MLKIFLRGVVPLSLIFFILLSKASATGEPATPQFLSPTNGQHISDATDLSFEWEEDTTAEDYKFFIYDLTSRQYIQKLGGYESRSSLCNNGVCSKGLTITLSDGHKYRWYLYARNSQGRASSVYSAFSFGQPLDISHIISPYYGEIVNDSTNLSYSWNEVVGATHYDFYIYDRNVLGVTNRKYKIPSADICNNGICTMTTDEQLEDARNHVWYVRARKGSLLSSLVTTHFHIATTPLPTTPQILSPFQGQSLASGENISYSWESSTNTDSYTFYIYDRVQKKVIGRQNKVPEGDICTNGICTISPDITLADSLNYVWYLISHNDTGSAPLVYTLFHVDTPTVPVCGNSFIESGEQCDDGNTTNGDSCDAQCLVEQDNGLPFTNANILAADYAKDVNPITLWKYITNGYHLGTSEYDHAADPSITYSLTDGDPLPSLDGLIHNSYRRLDTEGNQSIWDAENQGDQTRNQIGGWGAYSNLHVFETGKRQLVAFSIRLDNNSSIEYDVEDCSGTFQCSQVAQVKSIYPSGDPIFKVYEGRNGLRLSYKKDGVEVRDNVYLSRGEWHRFVLDVYWANDSSGSYRWWGDIDGDNVRNYVPLTPKRNVATVHSGSTASAFNFGPYHALSVPRNGRDYANIEFMEVPLNEPWE